MALLHSRPSSYPPRRSPPTGARFIHLRRWLFLGGISLVSLSTIGYFGLASRAVSALHSQILKTLGHRGFLIQDLLIEGRTYTPQDLLLQAAGCTIGSSVFATDLDAMRLRLETLPWIEAVIVERRLPNTLYIKVAERDPLARYQHGGAIYVIDRNGAEIQPIPPQDSRFQHLHLLVGEGANQRAPEFLQLLMHFPDLEKRVTALQWVSGRRWNLKMGGSITVLLPEQNPSAALQLLHKLERTGHLLEREVAEIDLRVPGKPLIQLTPSGLEKLRGEEITPAA